MNGYNDQQEQQDQARIEHDLFRYRSCEICHAWTEGGSLEHYPGCGGLDEYWPEEKAEDK
jgi:hypothetical protein